MYLVDLLPRQKHTDTRVSAPLNQCIYHLGLLGCVPAQWQVAIEAANASTMSVVPQLDMSGVLAATANPDGRKSWVELADGNVCERRDGSSLRDCWITRDP